MTEKKRWEGYKSPCSQAAAKTGPMAIKAGLNERDFRHNLPNVGLESGACRIAPDRGSSSKAQLPMQAVIQVVPWARSCLSGARSCLSSSRQCRLVWHRLRLLSGLVPGPLVETAGHGAARVPAWGSGVPGRDGGDRAMSVAVVRAAFQQAGTGVDGFIKCARIGYGVIRGSFDHLSRPWVGAG